jgi:4-hydroxybenzoyl-CoA thioesterase
MIQETDRPMARITIELPDRLPFSAEYEVLVNHLNRADHLDNVRLLTFVSETRTRFFKALGYQEMDVEGFGIIVADAALQYRSEAFWGDRLVVHMGTADDNRYGCDLVWRMDETGSGREVARGKTGIVFLDYATRKVSPMPEAFRDKAGRL